MVVTGPAWLCQQHQPWSHRWFFNHFYLPSCPGHRQSSQDLRCTGPIYSFLPPLLYTPQNITATPLHFLPLPYTLQNITATPLHFLPLPYTLQNITATPLHFLPSPLHSSEHHCYSSTLPPLSSTLFRTSLLLLYTSSPLLFFRTSLLLLYTSSPLPYTLQNITATPLHFPPSPLYTLQNITATYLHLLK